VAFFELAATLIPVFLLAGIVTERIRPQADDTYERTLLHASLRPTFATLGLVAEFLAINAVATGNSIWLFRWFVSGFLIASMVLAILLLWRPWLEQFQGQDRSRAHKLGRWVYGILTALALLGWVNLATGVTNGSRIEGANTYEHRYERNQSAQASLRGQTQDLTVEALNVRAQIAMARGERKPAEAISGLIKERRELRALLGEASGEQVELAQEEARLERELNG
jgi:hypothetical protein